MNMSKSSLLLIFLALSLFVSTIAAVPTSRSLNSMKVNSALQELHAEGITEYGERSEGFAAGGEGRMILENTDYPGTGANNRHDPRSPGRN